MSVAILREPRADGTLRGSMASSRSGHLFPILPILQLYHTNVGKTDDFEEDDEEWKAAGYQACRWSTLKVQRTAGDPVLAVEEGYMRSAKQQIAPSEVSLEEAPLPV